MNRLNKFTDRVKNKNFKVLRAKFKNGDAVFEKFIIENLENSQALIIYGENVSGKSFIGKLCEAVFRKDGVGVRSASVGNRTASGVEKAFIYGDESSQSTGATSFRVMDLCLNSSINDVGETLMILDEPDLGLSPKYSRTLGKYLAEKINSCSDDKYIIVVSHNADFLESFHHNLKVKPSHIGINTSETFDEWLKSDSLADIDDLMNLSKLDGDKYRAIYQATQENKK